MDLCYVKPEKLIRFSNKLKIEFLGANSFGSSIERHYLVNGTDNVMIASIESRTLEEDFNYIRQIIEYHRKHGEM